jgi:tetratricopeptide (TPR) repeat protein/TolB-like protein
MSAARGALRLGGWVFLLAVCATGNVVGQCPDGTPPPCGGRPGAAHVVAVDPGRIAVLPFRVTTSDSLLGEGFAELLATQFTGEGSPRAVDMATVLSAWRHAGGGLRSPLPRAGAVRLARELGAGLVTEGSIVGLGSRVVVTASLMSVPDGGMRGQTSPVSGSADSLDVLLQRTTTALLASMGGQTASPGVRFTDSPEAMRLYLEGLHAWRRGRLAEAADAFDRAIAADSSFAQAWFQRYLAANWGIEGRVSYAPLVWTRRAGLSDRERGILEALLGPAYPAPRTVEGRFAARRHLLERYPDSPDALYFLGDYYFHYGQLIDPLHHYELARAYLERAAAIDSQATVLNHLALLGLFLPDTALMRRTWPAVERTDDPARWMIGWAIAGSTGDATLLAALRRRPVPSPDAFEALVGGFAAGAAIMPARLFDEGFDRWIAAMKDPGARTAARMWRGVYLTLHGRPAAAGRVWREIPAPDSSGDEAALALDLLGGGAGLDAAAAAGRLAAGGAAGSACLVAVWRVMHGFAATADPAPFRDSRPRCARALEAALLARSTAPDADARLAVLDSATRTHVTSFTLDYYEGAVEAWAWERRGDAARALRASAAVPYPNFALPLTVRLAASVGDTALAVRAGRRYLDFTAEGEPAVAAARDSVRAELARLEHR